jgi:AhpD family alkylhydroperoxidase
VTARIAPGGLAELGPLNWLLCRAIARGAGTRRAHLFETLGRQRGLFRAWLWFASRLMPGGRLPARTRELVILRVAHLRGCRYELDHHERLGRRAGLDAADLARVAAGPAAAGWSERDRVLLAAVDALVRDRDVDDAAWAALRRDHGEPALVELCLLVGHYDLLAMVIGTLGIERDPPR